MVTVSKGVVWGSAKQAVSAVTRAAVTKITGRKQPGRKGLGWLMVSEVSVPLVGGGRTGLSTCPSDSPQTSSYRSQALRPLLNPLWNRPSQTHPGRTSHFSWTVLDSVTLIRLTMTMGNCGGGERCRSVPRGSLPSIGKDAERKGSALTGWLNGKSIC